MSGALTWVLATYGKDPTDISQMGINVVSLGLVVLIMIARYTSAATIREL